MLSLAIFKLRVKRDLGQESSESKVDCPVLKSNYWTHSLTHSLTSLQNVIAQLLRIKFHLSKTVSIWEGGFFMIVPNDNNRGNGLERLSPLEQFSLESHVSKHKHLRRYRALFCSHVVGVAANGIFWSVLLYSNGATQSCRSADSMGNVRSSRTAKLQTCSPKGGGLNATPCRAGLHSTTRSKALLTTLIQALLITKWDGDLGGNKKKTGFTVVWPWFKFPTDHWRS